jgi:long-chain acyl-CoA synthetase
MTVSTHDVLVSFADRLAEGGDKPAIVWRENAYSYGWLTSAIGRWSKDLSDAGVHAGAVVAIEGDYSPLTVALLLALFQMNAIVVPLTMSSVSRRAACRDIAEVQFAVRMDGGESWSLDRTDRDVLNSLTRRLIDEGHPGMVLFTSGSTGASKAALHDVTRFFEKYRRPRPPFVALAFLLLDHLGGMDTMLSILSNRGTLVVLETRDPEVVCTTIAKQRVELLPTTPTFLNLMLAAGAHERHDLTSLKRITYGTEPMPETTLQRLHAALPWVVLQQTYGLSEMGVLRTKSRDVESLWMKVGGDGYETKVVDGTLRIRARSAMLGYLNHPSPFDAEGWYDTGDLAVTEGEFTRFLGRRSEVINVGGEKVQPTEIENVLLAMSNVKEVVAFGERHALTGQVVGVRIVLREPEEPAAFRSRLRKFCREHLRPALIPAKITLATASAATDRMKLSRVDAANGPPAPPSDRGADRRWKFIEAAARAADGEGANRGPLVMIKAGRVAPRVVCVHGAIGLAGGFRVLSSALSEERGFWALEAPVWDSPAEPSGATVQEVAEGYVEALLRADPDGPFVIAGWSLGGFIALEMARQLSARGCTVRRLVAIDTYYGVPSLPLPVRTQLLAEVIEHIAGIVRGGPTKADALESLNRAGVPPTLPEGFELAVRILRETGTLPAADPPPIRFYRSSIRALAAYHAGALYDGPTTVIRSAESPYRQGAEDYGWARLASRVSILDAPGGHFSMLQQPHADALARLLEDCCG